MTALNNTKEQLLLDGASAFIDIGQSVSNGMDGNYGKAAINAGQAGLGVAGMIGTANLLPKKYDIPLDAARILSNSYEIIDDGLGAYNIFNQYNNEERQ